MDEHSKALLEECNSGEKMAIQGINQVRSRVTNEKFGELLDEYLQKHKELEGESERILRESGQEGKEPGIIASAFSGITTNLKLVMDCEDSKIAELMMDGCNMGIKSICKCQNQYCNVSGESKDHAEKLVRLEEEFMKELKGFV